jgi:putative transposase
VVKPPSITTERNSAMALDQSALLEVLDELRNADAADLIKQAAETIYQALIDGQLTAVIGAGPHERTGTRTNQRNGPRPRIISSTAGRLRAAHPHAAQWLVLPGVVGAAAPGRSVLVRGGD